MADVHQRIQRRSKKKKLLVLLMMLLDSPAGHVKLNLMGLFHCFFNSNIRRLKLVKNFNITQ